MINKNATIIEGANAVVAIRPAVVNVAPEHSWFIEPRGGLS